MELSLAHSVGSAVERACARSDLFEKRQAFMKKWAAYATGAEVNPSSITILVQRFHKKNLLFPYIVSGTLALGRTPMMVQATH